MGKRVVHCGEHGAGQAAKICNNMILGVSMIAVSEAFVLGEKLGLTHQALFDVASAASGQCWALTTNCPVPGPVPTSPANRDYQPGFAGALMAKDLRPGRSTRWKAPASRPGWGRSPRKSTIRLPRKAGRAGTSPASSPTSGTSPTALTQADRH